MNQRNTGQWPIALVGLAVLLMGGWTMYQEATPNLRGGTSAIERLLTMPDGEAPIGLTILSQHRALLDCEEVFRSERAIEMQYLQPVEREQLVISCGQMADAILAKSPTDSFAWLVRAAAHAAQDDNPGFNVALRNSQLSGPNEGWLANMRVQVAEANLTALTEETLIGHEHDMQVAATVYSPTLARRYVSDEDFRIRMTKVLETMQPQDQRRFLAAIRAALTTSGR